MDIISCIFIIILLFFIIFGLISGFLRSLLHYAKGIVSFVVALLLCKPIASLFFNASWALSGKAAINEWLCNTNSLFAQTFYPDQTERVLEAIKSLFIPNFFASFLADKITPSIPSEGIALGVSLADSLMNILIMVAAFIIILIVVRLLLIIISKFTKGLMDKLPGVKMVDRVLGLILGLFMGILVIDVICAIFTGIMSVPFFEGISNGLKQQMALDNPDTFTLSKYFYENNLLLKFISSFF